MSAHPDLSSVAHAIEEVNKLWRPHPGQVAAGRAVLYENVKRVMLAYARQTGKSSLISYLAVRWALQHANSQIAVVGPYLNQTRKIYLFSKAIEQKCPPMLLDNISMTDGRITFKNGSHIMLLGADNPDSLRGLTLDAAFVDEIKDLRDEFWGIIYPTVIARRAPLVIAGTPPGTADGAYWDLVREAQTDPAWRYYHLTSYDNPYLAKEDIDAERRRHERRGEEDVFRREWLAEYCPDARRNVFPFLTRDLHLRQHNELVEEVYRTLDRWQFVCALDPGTASVFGGVLLAIEPYKGLVRVLGDIYETQQANTSIGKVWPKIKAKIDEIYRPDDEDDPQSWTIVVDEAATWARAELLDQFGVPAIPTQKALNRKANGISLIKDLLLSKRLLISDRCTSLFREMETYALDQSGQFIKKNDHAIDALRYALAAANYTYVESTPLVAQPIPPDEQRRGFTPSQDYEALFSEFDPYATDLFND